MSRVVRVVEEMKSRVMISGAGEGEMGSCGSIGTEFPINFAR